MATRDVAANLKVYMNRKIVFEAASFARHAHRNHYRRDNVTPYTVHLGEVAGLIGTVITEPIPRATAWLHDSIEDVGITYKQLVAKFGETIALGVYQLTNDKPEGLNREKRKAIECDRAKEMFPWVQTVRYADILSNTTGCANAEPKFAKIYIPEKKELMKYLTKGDADLRQLVLLQLDIEQRTLDARTIGMDLDEFVEMEAVNPQSRGYVNQDLDMSIIKKNQLVSDIYSGRN